MRAQRMAALAEIGDVWTGVEDNARVNAVKVATVALRVDGAHSLLKMGRVVVGREGEEGRGGILTFVGRRASLPVED